MLTIKKEDVIKTIVIIWFVFATGYFAFDVYQGYKIRGMQAAYQQGYSDSVDQFISQTEKNGCNPLEVHKDDKKINVVNATCLSQANQQQAGQQQQPAQQQTQAKK